MKLNRSPIDFWGLFVDWYLSPDDEYFNFEIADWKFCGIVWCNASNV